MRILCLWKRKGTKVAGTVKMKSLAIILLISVFGIAFSAAVDSLAPDTLVLDPDARQIFVKEGGSQDLNCYINTTSSEKIEWETPVGARKEQLGQFRKSVDYSWNHSHLKIKGFSKDSVGTYTCKIKIGSNTRSSAITLLLAKEEKTTANFTYGDTLATLSCRPFLGDQNTIESVVWLKNNTPVSDLKEPERFKVIQENYTLEISEPTRDDADLYIARFTVKNLDEPYDCHVEYTAYPLVLDFEKSKNLIEEDKMELQCKVKGYPYESVTWLKNKKALNVSSGGKKRIHLSRLNGFDNARLVIKSVEFEDEGDYTCEVYSDLFNITSSKTITVRVKDKLGALWPFLGILAEVFILCAIIFIYEKRRNKRAEQEATTAQETSSSNKKEGIRHRGQKK